MNATENIKAALKKAGLPIASTPREHGVFVQQFDPTPIYAERKPGQRRSDVPIIGYHPCDDVAISYMPPIDGNGCAVLGWNRTAERLTRAALRKAGFNFEPFAFGFRAFK